MKGPVATCLHVFLNGEHDEVKFKFHCRKACRWYQCENGFNECDWRSVDDPGCCGHWQAQIEALRFLAEAATKEADELEADL